MQTAAMESPDAKSFVKESAKRRQWLLTLLTGLLVVLSTLTSVDRAAEASYEDLFHRAFITFALARTLNGVISAVQGTELALQPAGVGVTLTPGEILDPVNDLVERFSWIMLGATVSLGIQQVLLDVGQWWALRVLVALVGIAWIYLRASRSAGSLQSPGKSDRVLLRVFIIILFIRFAVPLALIANEALYGLFLEGKYLESTQVIETAGAEIERVGSRPVVEETNEQTSEEISLFEKLERALDSTRESLDLGQRVQYIQERTADLIEHLIQLCVVFILQTGILPIAFLWVFLQLFKQLIRTANSA